MIKILWCHEDIISWLTDLFVQMNNHTFLQCELIISEKNSFILSSSQWNVQEKFFEYNFSVVLPHFIISISRNHWKFQPDLVQDMLALRRLMWVQMKGYVFSFGNIIHVVKKIH